MWSSYYEMVRFEFTGRWTSDVDGLTHQAKLGNLEDFVRQKYVYSSCRKILVHVRNYNYLAPTTCMQCLGMAHIAWACTTEEFDGSP